MRSILCFVSTQIDIKFTFFYNIPVGTRRGAPPTTAGDAGHRIAGFWDALSQWWYCENLRGIQPSVVEINTGLWFFFINMEPAQWLSEMLAETLLPPPPSFIFWCNNFNSLLNASLFILIFISVLFFLLSTFFSRSYKAIKELVLHCTLYVFFNFCSFAWYACRAALCVFYFIDDLFNCIFWTLFSHLLLISKWFKKHFYRNEILLPPLTA